MTITNEYPPDYATPIGQVRALIPDLELLPDPMDLSAEVSYIFNDSQIQAYLVMGRNNHFRAAAIAVNAIASDEILILKNLRSDDRVTQGDKVGDSLGRRADWLNRQADNLDEEEALYEAFEIYPYIPHPPIYGLR